MSRKIRKRRLVLYEEANKRCYWCNQETVFPESGVDLSPDIKNLATVDHLRSKFHANRQAPNHENELRLVLACSECNSLRSQLENKIVFEISIQVYPFTSKSM